MDTGLMKRRDHVMGLVLGVSSLCNIGSFDDIAKAAGLPPEEKPGLCDENLEKELAKAWYEGGRGELPTVVGFWPMRTCSISNIVCLSLEKRQLYIFRVGSDQMIKGLGEGILSMKVGGKRRLYIPGPLAFPKGLTSAPGIHIQLLEYIPGLEVEEE